MMWLDNQSILRLAQQHPTATSPGQMSSRSYIALQSDELQATDSITKGFQKTT